MLKLGHGFVFCKKADQNKYYLPGMAAGDSGVLVWPLHKKVFPGSNSVWFSLVNSKTPCIMSVTNLNDTEWVGCSVSWRSWLWQTHKYPACKGTLDPGTRLIQEGGLKQLHILAAEQAR